MTTDLATIMDSAATDTLEGEAIRLLYVPLPLATKWDRNPKLHDLDTLKQSIVDHGFKDPPKWEPALNDGRGGIGEGNGRATALNELYDEQFPIPRGIRRSSQDITIDGYTYPAGSWFIPMLFGVDASSQAQAEAYAIDHNNLVLAGGGFADIDVLKLYDLDGYRAVLDDIVAAADAHIASVDVESLYQQLRAAEGGLMVDPEKVLDEKGGATGEESYWPVLKLQLHPETYMRYQSIMSMMHGPEFERFDRLLQVVDTAVLHETEFAPDDD